MKIEMSFKELEEYMKPKPVLCPNCKDDTIKFFLVDGKCHKCGCVLKEQPNDAI